MLNILINDNVTNMKKTREGIKSLLYRSKKSAWINGKRPRHLAKPVFYRF